MLFRTKCASDSRRPRSPLPLLDQVPENCTLARRAPQHTRCDQRLFGRPRDGNIPAGDARYEKGKQYVRNRDALGTQHVRTPGGAPAEPTKEREAWRNPPFAAPVHWAGHIRTNSCQAEKRYAYVAFAGFTRAAGRRGGWRAAVRNGKPSPATPRSRRAGSSSRTAPPHISGTFCRRLAGVESAPGVAEKLPPDRPAGGAARHLAHHGGRIRLSPITKDRLEALLDIRAVVRAGRVFKSWPERKR